MAPDPEVTTAPALSSRDRVNAALVAAALALVITGFLVTLYDDARWGGIILFAGAVSGILSVAQGPGDDPAGADSTIPRVFLIVALGVAPLVLLIIELFHPAGFASETYLYLSQPHRWYFGPVWWLTLHLIQTPAIGIVGAGLFVIMARIDNALAWLARAAVLVFIVYYTVLDSIGGIAVGALITHTRSWTGERRHVAIELVNFLFTNSAVGGTGSIISQLGSWAAFLAFFGVALTLARAGAPVIGSLLLAAGGVLIEISHARPYGPLGFACVLAAAGFLVPWRWRLGRDEPQLIR